MTSRTAVLEGPAPRPGAGWGGGGAGPAFRGGMRVGVWPASSAASASRSGRRASSCCPAPCARGSGPRPAEQGRLPEEPGRTEAPRLLILAPAWCKVRARAAAHLLLVPCSAVGPAAAPTATVSSVPPRVHARLAGSQALRGPLSEPWTCSAGQPLTLGFRVAGPRSLRVRSSRDIERCRPGRGGPPPGDGWGPSSETPAPEGQMLSHWATSEAGWNWSGNSRSVGYRRACVLRVCYPHRSSDELREGGPQWDLPPTGGPRGGSRKWGT